MQPIGQQPQQLIVQPARLHVPAHIGAPAPSTSHMAHVSPTPPMYQRFETLITSLTDSTKRDDIKYKDLREISESFEELTTSSACSPLVDSLIGAFIRVLHETQPQFISENNTLQLRKLVLELLLRLSTSESMKTYTKMIQTLLLRIAIDENEENALIIMKILTDQIKTFRLHYTNEVLEFFIKWKNAYREMLRYASQDRMFLSPDYFEANTRSIEDFPVVEALESCFITTVLSFRNLQQPNLKYSLIPRAKQSVRVLAEMTTTLMFLVQVNSKSHPQQQSASGGLLEHFNELIPLFIRYAEIAVPKHIRREKSYNKELVDEFHNSQVRALTCIAFTARHAQPMVLQVIEENASAIVNGIKQLFDGMHGDVIHQRRDLLVLIKFFFQCQCDIKSRFIDVIPRLLSDSLLIGTAFTAREQLRNQVHNFLADILHHVRMNLPFKILTHIYFFSTRNYHDPLLLPCLQVMYGKLIMNFVEPLISCPKQDESERKYVYDVLIYAIEAYVRKAVLIVDVYLPLIREKYRVGGGATTTRESGVVKSADSGKAASVTIANDSAQQQQLQKEMRQKAGDSAENSNRQPMTDAALSRTHNAGNFEPVASTSASTSTSAPLSGTKLTIDATSTKMPVSAASEQYPSTDIPQVSIHDCRNMIKYIIQPIKLITSKLREENMTATGREVELLSKFFVYGLKCLDIYSIATSSSGPYHKSVGMRSKEEKDITDTFIDIYSSLESSLFYDIVEQHMEFFVERIIQSVVLQSICSALLVQHSSGSKIGSGLVKYLLKRLPEMGTSNEKAILYLKLFKLVFSAVTYAQVNADCGGMLSPYVHEIVQESMKLSRTSRESINYFWLLRALFRSIGSGAHDLLYQQFLPQLPLILQQLNRLQNSAHRQSIHELFVELCLTVPVRLSSLLPYLPLLMDPLVCSLYGSATLVQQGLRTLELCVDNLQPEYFYDHMFPVRASLLQGLWHTVSTSDQQTAQSAFRIIGKFGGSSRKVLLDARTIEFQAETSDADPIVFELTSFRQRIVKQEEEQIDDEISSRLQPVPFTCNILLQELVESATAILRLPGGAELRTNNVLGVTTMGYGSATGIGMPQVQALEIISFVLLASMRSEKLAQMNAQELEDIFAKFVQHIKETRWEDVQSETFYAQMNPELQRARKLFSTALVGLFYAVVNNELKSRCYTLFKDIVRYLILQVILECAEKDKSDASALCAFVLVDALTTALADSCKEFCHAVVAALKFIIDAVRMLLNVEMICKISFFDYLLEQISLLCFRKEWYARLGGCTALRFIIEEYPSAFVRKNANLFLKSFTEITSGLADEVSFGALDYASVSMGLLVPICFPVELKNSVDESKMLHVFQTHIIECLHDAETLVRKEGYQVLRTLAKHIGRSTNELLTHCVTQIFEILTRGMRDFVKYSMESQIGVTSLYVFAVNENGLRLDILPSILYSFIRNLLIIIDSRHEELLQQLKYLPCESNLSAKTIPSKCLSIRRMANDALVAWLCDASIVASDDQTTLAKQAFSLLLNNATSKALSAELQEQSQSAIKEIIERSNLSATFCDLIGEKFFEIFAEHTHTNDDVQLESKLERLKYLILLNKCSKRLTVENIQRLKDDIRTYTFIPKEENTKRIDLEHVFLTLQLSYDVLHRDFEFFKTCLTFIAEQEFKLSEITNIDWLAVLTQGACLHAEEVAAFFVEQIGKVDNSYSAALAQICIKIIQHKESKEFQKVLALQNPLIIQIFESIMEDVAFRDFNFLRCNNDGRIPLVGRILRILNVVLQLVNADTPHFSAENELFDVIRRLWNSVAFRNVFAVRREFCEVDEIACVSEQMDTTKYDVPVVCAQILLARLRYLLSSSASDNDTIDLLYDLVYGFCYPYISDFSFMRTFIDAKLIPFVSLNWKRNAFKKVIDMLKALEENRRATGVVQICDEQLVRFMQYVVMPALYFAFENFEVDLVVGDSDSDNNLMATLISYIDSVCPQNRDGTNAAGGNKARENVHCMSDTMTIVMYQFCVLLVQNCPFYIHDMSKRHQEGNRLRLFMLFGWPCLQANFSRDLTEKYAGHLLIANIIDKFAINRKIVLQVLSSLVLAHHHDHKEIVRKALDILVPAVPRRMDDGHLQLYSTIKKTIVEESRNISQVAVHCLNIIIRHHKVFYFVRHQLSPLILNTLQRLLTTQYGFESRRLVADICDIFIKWEQERQRIIGFNETNVGESASMDVSETANTDSQGVGLGSSNNNGSNNNLANGVNDSIDEIHLPIDKAVIDEVIFLLVKTATATFEMVSGNVNSANNEQISKRCIYLLRVAMKPTIFGNVATMRSQWFEKQLTLPNPEQMPNEQALSSQLSQVQVTLDLLVNLILYLPSHVITNLFRNLQHNLIDCLSSSMLVRSAFSVIGRLMEKSNTTEHGLVEFEALNQFIAKYIHDSFVAYFNSLSNSTQQTLMAVTLMKIIYGVQPAYLETVCLAPFLKMLQRQVRDYQMPSSNAKPPTSESGQKISNEALCICLDILWPRTKCLNFDEKKTVAQHILMPLIEKGATDKVLESLMKVVHELVIDNTGTNLGVGLLIRMCVFLKPRLTHNANLLRSFLESVLFVFECEHFSNCFEIIFNLNSAFFWGLSFNDHSIRNRCFNVLEKYFPRDPFHRLIYIFTKQNWQLFGNYFWISHVAHLLMLSNHEFVASDGLNLTFRPRFSIKTSATFSQCMERIVDGFQRLATSDDLMEVDSDTTIVNGHNKNGGETSDVKIDESEPMDVDREPMNTTNGTTAADFNLLETEIKKENVESAFLSNDVHGEGGAKRTVPVELFESCNRLLQSAKNNELGALIVNIADYLHYDWRVARKVFIELFRSCWRGLSDDEHEELQRLAQPFLASAKMLAQKDAPISAADVFLEALETCEPPVQFTPPLLSYIGKTHNCWHFVIDLLERRVGKILLNNEPGLKSTLKISDENLEAMESLAYLYSQLNEPDQLWMVWRRRCNFNKTALALALFNQSEFTLARELFEKMMNQLNEHLGRKTDETSALNVTPALLSEVQFWERFWINSCKELNDWTTLSNYANRADIANAGLLMESAWHAGEWHLLNDCITQVDPCADPQLQVKSSLFKAMSIVKNCDPTYKDVVDKSLLDINKNLIADWRRLPRIVSTSHIGLLLDAHLLHEVSEANSTLLFFATNGGPTAHLSVNNVKHVMKSWRSRSLTQIDPLSACIDIFTWRFQHFNNSIGDHYTHQQSSFLIHSLAQSQLNLVHSLRKSNQIEMALCELIALNRVPTILPMDGQQKVCEEVKCLMKLAERGTSISDRLKLSSQAILTEALDVLENTETYSFKKEQSTRLNLLKGVLLSKLDRRDETSAIFSNAALEEKSSTGTNSQLFWKYWGCHLEKLFLSNPIEVTALNFGVQALINFLECAKASTPIISRVYLARVFWLIKMISSVGGATVRAALDDALANHIRAVPFTNWLFWLNQIIADIQQRPNPTSPMAELLRHIAKAHPQPVFYALRVALGSQCVTERLSQLFARTSTFIEWNASITANNCDEMRMHTDADDDALGSALGAESSSADWREHCLLAVDALFIRQPTNILCLNEILSELELFKPSNFEMILYKLRDLLNVCSDYEFANISDLSDETIKIKISKDVVQKASQFVDFLNSSLTALDSNHKHYQLILAMQDEINTTLNDSASRNQLQRFTSLIRRLLAVVVQVLRFETENREFFLRDTSTILDRFKNKMATIEIFSGHISSRVSTTHTIHIAHFMSIYRCFARQSGVRRLIQVRALNGKIYSYFLEHGDTNSTSNYILQLLTMLNKQFAKDRSMCQRLMQLAIPRSIDIGIGSRLIECCPISGVSPQFSGANSNVGGVDFADALATKSLHNFMDIFNETFRNHRRSLHASNDIEKTDENNFYNDQLCWPADSWSGSLEVVDYYYQRVSSSRCCHKMLFDLFNEISSNTQPSGNANLNGTSDTWRFCVPRDLLKRWISAKYPDPAKYWIVRRNLSIGFALMGLVEHALFLSPLQLNGLFIDLSSTQLFYGGYRFDLSKKIGEKAGSKISIIELDGNRSVSFRMSANISHFLDVSIKGHASGAILATAKCLSGISMDRLLRPILWDVFYEAAAQNGNTNNDGGDATTTTLKNVVVLVENAVNAILSHTKTYIPDISHIDRAQALRHLDSSYHADNLCRMDPNWHPWF